jgi:hypothetical protein
MIFGGILISLGIILLLLDRFHKSTVPNQESEIRIGNLSFKGGAAIIVLFLGIIVYFLEEGIIQF